MSTMDPQDPNAGGFPPPPGYGATGPGSPGYGVPAYGAPAPGGMPELASWGTRAVAAIIDALISGAAQAIVYPFNKGLAQLVGIAVFVFLQFRQGTTGRTPGKEVMKIRLLREQDGQVVGFGNAVVRGIVHFVDGITCFIGYLWPLWDDKKQTFADKIMKTVVVKA